MRAFSRRQFLSRAAATAASISVFSARPPHLHANPLGLPIGSQTWPHRVYIRDGKFAELLEIFRKIGVEKIELMSAIGWRDFASLRDGRQTKKIIEDHGIKCDSTQVNIRELREDQAASIAWAQALGLKHMIVPTLSGTPPRTVEEVKRAADEYNRMAEVAAKEGIQQGLHNEGFENAMLDGRRVYDMLFELLDPKLVKFEFQMSSLNAGMVGADYFIRYPGRFVSIHLQDIDMNAPLEPSPQPGGQPRHPQVPVGKGSIDWAKTFNAAKTGGVSMYYVEQTMEFTKESVAFLKYLKA